jgi:hypothetical protein
MPDMFVSEGESQIVIGPFLAADVGAPRPIASPLVFATPGTSVVMLPETVGTVTIEQWGAGGSGGKGSTTTGGNGGGSGAYAKYTAGGGLFTAGSKMTVEVGVGAPDQSVNGTGSKVTFAGGAAHVVSEGGRSNNDNIISAAQNTVTAGAGLVVVTNDPGTVGGTGDNGGSGAGGDAPGTGGGKGGLGVGNNAVGNPGNAPGAGGSGGGLLIPDLRAGAGAPGRVVITWV